jgi:hypothetical protein
MTKQWRNDVYEHGRTMMMMPAGETPDSSTRAIWQCYQREKIVGMDVKNKEFTL